jgi:hypothetical protein
MNILKNSMKMILGRIAFRFQKMMIIKVEICLANSQVKRNEKVFFQIYFFWEFRKKITTIFTSIL